MNPNDETSDSHPEQAQAPLLQPSITGTQTPQQPLSTRPILPAPQAHSFNSAVVQKTHKKHRVRSIISILLSLAIIGGAVWIGWRALNQVPSNEYTRTGEALSESAEDLEVLTAELKTLATAKPINNATDIRSRLIFTQSSINALQDHDALRDARLKADFDGLQSRMQQYTDASNAYITSLEAISPMLENCGTALLGNAPTAACNTSRSIDNPDLKLDPDVYAFSISLNAYLDRTTDKPTFDQAKITYANDVSLHFDALSPTAELTTMQNYIDSRIK